MEGGRWGRGGGGGNVDPFLGRAFRLRLEHCVALSRVGCVQDDAKGIWHSFGEIVSTEMVPFTLACSFAGQFTVQSIKKCTD